ncbi:MAG: chemotaxis protein CheD [Marinilabiliales bacterium]|nr:MAG: chemotaxis protein CheD [Marinilabiliales bacterium]
MTEPLKFFLLPGAIKVSKRPMEITTLLGSCVAVCLWDKKLHYGGINHYLMPFWNGNGLASPKYGNIAIERLINNMVLMGCDQNDIVAKVFGGASMLNSSENSFSIGSRNIEFQKEELKNYRIKTIASSLGGVLGRKIVFNTETGLIKMKYIKQ